MFGRKGHVWVERLLLVLKNFECLFILAQGHLKKKKNYSASPKNFGTNPKCLQYSHTYTIVQFCSSSLGLF